MGNLSKGMSENWDLLRWDKDEYDQGFIECCGVSSAATTVLLCKAPGAASIETVAFLQFLLWS